MSEKTEKGKPEEHSLEVWAARPGDPGAVWCREFGNLDIPEGWEFLKRGNPFITRKAKALGPTWILLYSDKRRRITRREGLYAPKENIIKAAELETATAGDRAKKRSAGERSRGKKEAAYRGIFEQAVIDFLAFAPEHLALAKNIAADVAARACQVGSGTVGRTGTLPLKVKVRLATIAHIRHNHTGYEDKLNETQVEQDGILTDDQYHEIKSEAISKAEDFIAAHRK